VCYLEVVSTTSESVAESLAAGRALGVDHILGGTDCDAAERALGGLDRYFRFRAVRPATLRASVVRRPTSSAMRRPRAPAAAPVSTSSPTERPTPIRSRWSGPRAGAWESAR